MEIEKTISLIGCGWLGIPLGIKLLDCCCYVKGSTQTTEKLPVLRGHGIEPFLIKFSPRLEGSNTDEFFSSDVAIIMLPPSREMSKMHEYPFMIETLMQHIQDSPIENVLFISSTSVYGNLNRKVTEQDAGIDSSGMGQIILDAEKIVSETNEIKSTILRFSGLFGPGRNPGRFFAGKSHLKGGGDPVNYIHLDDCLNIMCKVIEHNVWGEIFNASSDEHPTKKHFYTTAAELSNLKPPEFEDEHTTAYKIIDSSALKNKLNYEFKYSNPLDALKGL
jgi:hypothetical protein